MSVNTTAASGPPPGPIIQDVLSQRLRWAVVVSVLINILIWRAASGIARQAVFHDIRPVEITRVVIDKGRKIEKVVTKKQIEKKVAQVHKQIQKRRPEWKPPKRIAKATPPPPQGAHHHVLTAKPDKNAPAKAEDHTALAGGNAQVGKPIEQQNPGNAVVNPPTPPAKTEVKPAPPPPPPPKTEETKPAPPVKTEETKPAPVETKPEVKPEPPPPPKPKGPTKDAEPANEVKPEIPDDLKHGSYKSFVRVKVVIDEDGSFEPILRTSSGNDEIDRRVLEALKRWKWKPALKDGVPVKSTQLFKFEFEVD